MKRLVYILDCRIKQLCNKQIPLFKILWTNYTSSEATLEIEKEMKAKYPYLFEVTLHILARTISFKEETL